MEKEVMVVTVPSIDFNFNSNCSSPYNTAPSSPQHFPNNFFKYHHQPINTDNQDEDFEFNFNTHLQKSSLSADQLFHAGKILPLNLISPSHPHHQTEQKLVEELQEQEDEEEDSSQQQQQQNKLFGYYRKWRIKDFLLFRSASEGRASERDPLRKYRVLSKTTAYEDVTGSSFRSVENSGSVSKRRKPVSAHELHYTLNRAASEDLKRKTMLPYKQGLLGCLGFNHGMNQISGRFGSFKR
ncbi:hypothetical protein TSUD_15980 [Trifolium subterraneum]|uniref:Uncharacterized protein n=1 Tax=Trifolium subterraneum TaxID=3900 RepID=A0A2Z6NLC4_TRISU|nr:hypothetical protein TSUD_15980 [Trifolium subterraneum]